MGSLTIVGLGPGGAGLLSLEARAKLSKSARIIMRTSKHPAVEELSMEGLSFGSCDKFYEEGRSFEEVYEKIVAYVLEEAAERDTVFAVPGSPLVAERTVLLLRAACEARQLPLTILPAISFLDLAYVRLNLDPVNGLRIADASDREAVLAAGRYPLIITQVYSRLVAAELKLNLMEALGDEEEIFFMRNLGLADEECRAIKLFELDRQKNIDHLTSVFVPAAARGKLNLNPLIEVVKTLREPGGCVWDREQTHASIRRGLIEETYELLEAIDNKDEEGMKEELGDVLLQVVFHARIAEEEGCFKMQDVIDGIVGKLVTRHPHVFGTVEVSNAEEVIQNWEAIKAEEKQDRKQALDGVSPGLPTLMRAYKLQTKAARVGFDWPKPEGAWEKVLEELEELREAAVAGDTENCEWETGDLLFAVVNYARHLGLEPETSLNRTNNRFVERFTYVEDKVRASGKDWQDFSLVELEKLWQEAKKSKKS